MIVSRDGDSFVDGVTMLAHPRYKRENGDVASGEFYVINAGKSLRKSTPVYVYDTPAAYRTIKIPVVNDVSYSIHGVCLPVNTTVYLSRTPDVLSAENLAENTIMTTISNSDGSYSFNTVLADSNAVTVWICISGNDYQLSSLTGEATLVDSSTARQGTIIKKAVLATPITVNSRMCEFCSGTGTDMEGEEIQCPDCNGDGYIYGDCQNCNGTGVSQTVPCPDCNGMGVSTTATCPDCNGMGVITRVCWFCDGRKELSCPACGGSASLMCEICGGDGCEICDYKGVTNCYNCTTGFVQCSECNGTGKLDGGCNTCNGTGKLDGVCSTCVGTGQVDNSNGTDCAWCNGSGKDISAICATCYGLGTTTIYGGKCSMCGGIGYDLSSQLDIVYHQINGTCSDDIETVYISKICEIKDKVYSQNDPDYIYEEIDSISADFLVENVVASDVAENTEYNGRAWGSRFSATGFSHTVYIVWGESTSESPTLETDILVSQVWTDEYENPCLSADTLITMHDGSQRRMDEIKTGDIVLAENGVLTKVHRTARGVMNPYHILYHFEDGTTIDETHDHRFYNVEQGFWQRLKHWKIGDHAISQNGSEVALVSVERIEEEAETFGIFTDTGTYYANGLLSGAAECNMPLLANATTEQAVDMVMSIDEKHILNLLGLDGVLP